MYLWHGTELVKNTVPSFVARVRRRARAVGRHKETLSVFFPFSVSSPFPFFKNLNLTVQYNKNLILATITNMFCLFTLPFVKQSLIEVVVLSDHKENSKAEENKINFTMPRTRKAGSNLSENKKKKESKDKKRSKSKVKASAGNKAAAEESHARAPVTTRPKRAKTIAPVNSKEGKEVVAQADQTVQDAAKQDETERNVANDKTSDTLELLKNTPPATTSAEFDKKYPAEIELMPPSDVPIDNATPNDILFGRGGLTNQHPGTPH